MSGTGDSIRISSSYIVAGNAVFLCTVISKDGQSYVKWNRIAPSPFGLPTQTDDVPAIRGGGEQ